MTSKLAFIAAALLAVSACDKGKDKDKTSGGTTAVGTVAADGTRSIPVQVKKDGYHPDKIQVKPNEKLKLIFTRVEDTECGAQVKVAGGSVVDLPLNQAVEIPLTAPASGEVKFLCGMDMMTGAIVVDAKG
jgi:plastocyanin domain-containing protein